MNQHLDITVVLPGRNVGEQLRETLESVTALLRPDGPLSQAFYVDDSSTDNSCEIAASFPIRVISANVRGAGAARNLGWRAATARWIWFLDADCVPNLETITRLAAHLTEDRVAGIGGSLTNRWPSSLLASLIHEEVAVRHQRMAGDTEFLATGNVIYRRDVLEEVEGFDERFLLAQDADLAFRIRQHGYRLLFEPKSLVAHGYPTLLIKYLYKQAGQGYYRMLLYRRHPGRIAGDSYSSWTDHVQPPLAMITLITLPLAALQGWWRWLPLVSALLLWTATLPMSFRMVRRTGQLHYLLFSPLAFLRAFARGIGMVLGLFAAMKPRKWLAETDAEP